MTKIFLVLWIMVGGRDVGGPPVEYPSAGECELQADKIRAMPVPAGADLVRVGCVTEKRAGDPT